MSNDYFKAQGWFKTYALNSQDSRGVFQQLVKEDEEAFRLASAETDRIKEEMNKKLGPGTVKYGSEIPQPEMKTPQAIFEFTQRNPAAEGGRMKFDDGLSALNFGKEQSIFSQQNFQKILGAAGQRDYAPAYKVVINALKKAGIEYTPAKSTGSSATFDNVTKETIDIFNKEATKLRAEAGLPMSRYQTNQLKKDIKIFVKDKLAKGEYVSRPVIIEHFGLGNKSGNMLITRSLGVNEKAGTGLLKKLGQDEQKAAAKANFAKGSAAQMETKNDVLKIINDEFRLDPDLSNSEDLAKTIYGDQFPKGDMKNMSIEDLRKAEAFVRQTDNDVMSYLRVIKGLRDKPDGMRLPTQNVINDITDNILSGIEDESAEGKSQFKKKGFRFSSGLLRDYKMAIINKNLGLDTNVYKSERAKLILKNKNLDEIFSLSALADIAPGYTTKVQSIKKLINMRKASEIDLPFQKIMNALNEGKTSMQWNGKTVPIEDAIKSFNKTSSKFSKREKVQSPKINYNEKFDESILDSYGKASQENIKKVYKNKNFFLSDIDPKIKTQDVLKDMEAYITDRTGKVKRPSSFIGASSGFNTDLIAEDLKKIVNSEGFKTFKAKIANPALKTAVGAAKLPTKIFGAADLVLGYLDYTNNRQKGFSKEDSTRHMVDAVLFGVTSFGEKGDIAGVREIANKNGMSNEVFDNLMALNLNQKKMMDTIDKSKAKFNQSMDIIESGVADPMTEKLQIQKLKKDTNTVLAETMRKIVDDSRSLNTNLQVQEAGAPIGINVDTQKAYSDLGSASREFVQNRIDASDPKVFEQGDTTMGKIGSTIKETIMQPDFYTGFFKQTKAQKDREDMEKLKIQDPTMYYKMLMSEGVDPRIKLNIPVQLEFERNRPEFGTQYSDSLTQNKAEGGITSLRSKYEYKK